MRTDDLIASLSTDLQPVRKGAIVRTLAIGVAAGVLGSVLLMMAMVGVRHDLGAAMQSSSFWMKFLYTLAIAVLGAWIVERTGRPGTRAMLPTLLLALPLVAILGLATAQMMPADADRHTLMMGGSSRVCAALITLFALPLFGEFSGRCGRWPPPGWGRQGPRPDF